MVENVLGTSGTVSRATEPTGAAEVADPRPRWMTLPGEARRASRGTVRSRRAIRDRRAEQGIGSILGVRRSSRVANSGGS
jgi:hypothetical protein